GPGTDQSIEFFLVLFSLLNRGKPRIRQPRRVCGATKALPFMIILFANHAPFAVAAWVTSMRRGECIAIAIAVRDDAIRRVVKHRGTDELHAGFKLGEIDVRTLAGQPPMIQSCQHGDRSNGHRDDTDLWTV